MDLKIATELELTIAVQTWDVDKLKLLLKNYVPTTKNKEALNVLLVRVLSTGCTERMSAKGYEMIKILIDYGAQLVGDTGSGYECLFKFVEEKIAELRSTASTASKFGLEIWSKAELDLTEILELLVTRGGADAVFTKVVQDQTIVTDCCNMSAFSSQAAKSTFPLLKFFLDRGLDTQLCEDSLNYSLVQDWGISALLIEFGTNCPPGWDLQKYLCSFQTRYPDSKTKIEKGLRLRGERQKLIRNHLFQSISPACAASFDVTPLCTIIAEYYFQLWSRCDRTKIVSIKNTSGKLQ